MVSRGPYQFVEVRNSSLLLTEGIDDARFLDAFLNHINKSGIQIAVVEGKDNFRPFLSGTLVNSRNFARLNKLAIVRDADDNPQAAFQSLCDGLFQAKLPVPSRPWGEHQSDSLTVSIAILPDENSTGNLEDLCLRAIQSQAQSQPALSCVDQYISCLQASAVTLNHQSKTRLHAYLAAGDRPGLRLGEAADASVWDWDSPALGQLAAFLGQL